MKLGCTDHALCSLLQVQAGDGGCGPLEGGLRLRYPENNNNTRKTPCTLHPAPFTIQSRNISESIAIYAIICMDVIPKIA